MLHGVDSTQDPKTFLYILHSSHPKHDLSLLTYPTPVITTIDLRNDDDDDHA